MAGTKKFTILHSNDMHGDFLAELGGEEGGLLGGLPLLSGYINKVRAEEDNVLYCISGDMVQGSIIDSDFKGTSKLTHPLREQETSLGNLMADAIADSVGTDVVLLGAGSVRVKEMGPAVTLMDLVSCFPYDDSLTRYTVTGANLKRMFGHWMRVENRNGEGECCQVNGAVRAVYSDGEHRLVSLAIGGAPVDDAVMYTVTMQGYHAKNCESYLAISPAELEAAAPGKIVASSAQTVLREWLLAHQNVGRKVEGRLVYE